MKNRRRRTAVAGDVEGLEPSDLEHRVGPRFLGGSQGERGDLGFAKLGEWGPPPVENPTATKPGA